MVAVGPCCRAVVIKPVFEALPVLVAMFARVVKASGLRP